VLGALLVCALASLADGSPSLKLVQTFDTGLNPNLIATDRVHDRAYVSNLGEGTVAVVDLKSLRVLRKLDVPGHPLGLALSADGNTLYTGSFGSDVSHGVDLATGEVVVNLPTQGRSSLVGATPDDRFVLIVSFETGTLNVYDAQANFKRRSVAIGANPFGLVISADGQRAYTLSSASGRITVVDIARASVVRTLNIAPGHLFLAVSADERTAYSSNRSGVSVIDLQTAQVRTTILTGSTPHRLALSPDGRFVAVANAGSDSVSLLDTATSALVATLSVGDSPVGVAWASATRFLVANEGASNATGNTVSVVEIRGI